MGNTFVKQTVVPLGGKSEAFCMEPMQSRCKSDRQQAWLMAHSILKGIKYHDML